MVKSKLLEFEKTLEDEVCSNVLFRLHKVIDESFPTAQAASGKFSQTVVANYDQIVPPMMAGKSSGTVPPVPPVPPSMNQYSPQQRHPVVSKHSSTSSSYSSPYSQQIFSSTADSVYVPKSKQKKSLLSSFIKTKKPKGFNAQDYSSTNFETSRADEIFSDKYLNKVARKSKPGFFKTMFKLILFALIVTTITIFVMGKQHQALQIIKNFPTYYSEQLKPKLEEFKSYFKSNSDSKKTEEEPSTEQKQPLSSDTPSK